MEINGTQIGEELAAGFLGLLLFGVFYNWAIEKFPWLAQRRSAEQVVFGVLVTLIVSGFTIGWVPMLQLMVLFAGSGTPMIFGSWIRAAKDDEKAKKIQKDLLG